MMTEEQKNIITSINLLKDEITLMKAEEIKKRQQIEKLWSKYHELKEKNN